MLQQERVRRLRKAKTGKTETPMERPSKRELGKTLYFEHEKTREVFQCMEIFEKAGKKIKKTG